MSYLSQDAIANSVAMLARVAQAAASEGAPDNPDAWAATTRREWAAAPGWDAAWESAMVGHEDDDPPYDPGLDEAVITDAMILSQVQAMLSSP
jgi:hypothetical protein